ncbi:MAG: site-specific integrase [Gemmataceae bacterium]|nr:site-specific integrase [Gemmataceae bacterium]
MASISRDPNGRRRILFTDRDGGRKTIRLGKVSQRMAEEIKIKVEALNAAKIGGCSLDRETAAWVANLGDGLHGKLAAVGLTEPRRTARLGEFLDGFIANRKPTAAPSTIISLNQVKTRLIDQFGAERDLRSITPADAEGWAAALAEQGYAPATAGRAIKRARQFCKAALRDKLITENPFAEIKASGQVNKERQFHVDRETIFRVIDAAPNAEWRLIIALSRFGGLRCPSEHLALRWQDMDWERNRFRVDSPKTGERWIPMFPELRPHLEAAFELAEDGAVFVITSYRSEYVNMRMQLARIIRRAGAKVWPKLFHNLRASRETELAAEYPIHVVCEWIGNTAAIAAKHYLTVREEDFERAAQGGAKSGALEAHFQAQQASATVSTGSQELTEGQGDCGDMRGNADGRKKTSGSVQVPGGLGTIRRSRKVLRWLVA